MENKQLRAYNFREDQEVSLSCVFFEDIEDDIDFLREAADDTPSSGLGRFLYRVTVKKTQFRLILQSLRQVGDSITIIHFDGGQAGGKPIGVIIQQDGDITLQQELDNLDEVEQDVINFFDRN